MSSEHAKKAQGILDRLNKLEQSQKSMMTQLHTTHEEQMAQLRQQLAQAQERRREAQERAADTTSQPLLLELNMTEVEAAVEAASFAEQESAAALEEARQVANDARLAAGGIPQAIRDVTPEGDVGYGADSEYIVKRVSINLDAVERAISSSPLVNVCRAFGRPDSKYGNEVYCAVVPKPNTRVSEPMMLMHAQKYLMTAMVPKRFFFLENLPSGITRKALADTQLAGDGGKKPPLPAIEG